MKPLMLLGVISFKKEITIVLVSLAVIVSLPVVALASVVGAQPAKDTTATLYAGPISVTNTYDFGYCTYWAALRREQDGHPIPNSWGNANTWAYRALAQGFKVSHIPAAGSVMQTTAGPLGHVAYVESVNPADGSWTISEMNFKGWDVVDNRTLSARAASDYYFIQ